MTEHKNPDLVTLLTEGRPPRVWSLLVTIFGDLAQAEGTRLTSTVLTALAGQVGIKPEATRVALHRLRKDGWLTSEKFGRQTAYRLTPQGRKESADASPRIYAQGPWAEQAWLVIIPPETAKPTASDNVVWVAAQTGIAPAPLPRGLSVPIPQSTPLPGWMSDQICDAAVLQATNHLSEQLERLEGALPAASPLSPLDVAAVRMMVVHDWRRVALKHPGLPDFVFPKGWTGAICRNRAHHLLARLPAPALSDLEHAATTP